jgi:hypothetical protein
MPSIDVGRVADAERLVLKTSLTQLDELFIRRDTMLSRLAVTVTEVREVSR